MCEIAISARFPRVPDVRVRAERSNSGESFEMCERAASERAPRNVENRTWAKFGEGVLIAVGGYLKKAQKRAFRTHRPNAQGGNSGEAREHRPNCGGIQKDARMRTFITQIHQYTT